VEERFVPGGSENLEPGIAAIIHGACVSTLQRSYDTRDTKSGQLTRRRRAQTKATTTTAETTKERLPAGGGNNNHHSHHRQRPDNDHNITFAAME
jgi:hypothetical protein